MAKQSRTPMRHRTEILMNRDKVKAIMMGRGLEFTDLYRLVVERFGLDLTYKGFMSVVANQATWKLLYAYAVSDVLNVQIMDIFELVENQIEN